MKKFTKYLLMLGLFLLASVINPFNSKAQLPGDPGCDPLDPACPIDGGVSLLIAAGIGIGARKAYKMKKAGEK